MALFEVSIEFTVSGTLIVARSYINICPRARVGGGDNFFHCNRYDLCLRI